MRLGVKVGGRYELTHGPIRGGRVARDTELGRAVVLKRVESTTAFKARALARFSHRHVVTLYDAVRGRGRSWLVLEYVPSGSLDRWPTIEPELAARVGAQIADAATGTAPPATSR
ncbi:hypothetical protein [Actinomadura rugatobispora]|uniref:Protein kinase domain-containing protein n=1 Tax=Actinomadura rugatobispora TaxID=1994 RepID=A0ABW0ZYR8_9ACTN|nr:hypothetical protein GCM10010200_038530 [Actinomadura rugatobispora]